MRNIYSILTCTAAMMMAFSAATARAASPVYIEYDEGENADDVEIDTVAAIDVPQPIRTTPLPPIGALPAIYHPYDIDLRDPMTLTETYTGGGPECTQWLRDELRMQKHLAALRQYHAIHYPWDVHYNINTLPEPPKQYVLTVDPSTAAISIHEIKPKTDNVSIDKVDVSLKHWLNKLEVGIQFSQAFISPNWYQGGNNSLNLISDFKYTSNLNTKFHPNLLFENTFQWRTVVANAPDDPYRNYNLTENRFQINTKFGYKAAHNWYYSLNGVLKTPIFNGYTTGTTTMTAALFSPGELNIGLGMTYNATVKKKFTFGATVAPLSYNLKTVLNSKVSETLHGLEEGHKTLSSYGSNIDLNWTWTMCYNVKWTSRVFVFTNYDYITADWQNQFAFTINRFLSANLNVDMRYDSSVHPDPDSKWRKLQLKELLSFGFSYTF